MPKTHRPKRGSHGFSPRKRAQSRVPRLTSWPDGGDEPKIQGFAGYKAGMTHTLLTDYRPNSLTTGQHVQVPVTVIEVPEMRIAGVRLYRETPYGLKTLGEAWTDNVDELLKKRLPVPKAAHNVDDLDIDKADDVRLLAYTQPRKVSGVTSKSPEFMELRVGGGDLAGRFDFAKGKLGAEFDVTDVFQGGQMIDVAAVTKGKGYQGAIRRWGVKLQSHKNSKNRRDASPLGPFVPRFIRSTVPMPGQTGYHNRTEYNKRILKIGENGEEITPAGGFLHYGVVRNKYLLLHGSIPGPAKRMIRLREASRYLRGIEVGDVDLAHVSTASKQGA